ncbi:hypothetical protein [Dechloromonas denitrificans]|uniref:hypothetical protein n=1 Tax=Dechloromonas denitrificans TaxID=281362 RepID=UPI001CF8A15C|nr:hypothetical protein [Dechloromonas denitrificans]UCV01741.1 hypothetical protein KI611_11465 [Dechloromonas denitrificans]
MKAVLSKSEKARQAGQRGARSKHSAAKAQREADEAMQAVEGKSARAIRPAKRSAPGDVPPYCYRLPGMSAEEGAVVAVKILRIAYACDALAILWELRRDMLDGQTDGEEYPCACGERKTQQRPLAHVLSSVLTTAADAATERKV